MSKQRKMIPVQRDSETEDDTQKPEMDTQGGTPPAQQNRWERLLLVVFFNASSYKRNFLKLWLKLKNWTEKGMVVAES